MSLRHLYRPLQYLTLLAFVAAGCQTQAPPLALQSASADLVRNSVYYLASPEREGRGPGTAGLDEAACYVAGYYHSLHLQPPPRQKSFFQPFTFTTVTGLAASTRLQVDSTSLKLSDDYSAPVFTAEGSFSGPVVFAGYGVTAKDPKNPSATIYDDYAGVDVHGKIALVMRFEPHRRDGRSRLADRDFSENSSLPRKAKLAAAHGAVALLVVHPPDFHGDETYTSPIVPMARAAADRSPIPVIQIKQRIANQMLEMAGAKDLRTFQRELDEKFAARSFSLGKVRVAGTVAFERSTYNLRNVIACLPGRGRHANEYIVIGAHYDHLGHGGTFSREPRSHSVHPGADDNASGTAAVMELARIFSLSKQRPSRSLMFVNFSGEEEGLIGSEYFVNHPPVPLKRIVAMVNLDMVGRLRNEQLLVGGVGTASPFVKMLDAADAASPLKLKESFGTGISPSDNASFILKRIPSLFFWTNLHADYHRPGDTPDKINYPGESQVIDLVAKVVESLARAPERDLKFVEPPPAATTQRSTHGGGVSLGVVPDYTEDSTTKGLRITGTVPGSAAAAAGLQAGDIIVQIDAKEIASIYDLTDFLNMAEAGKPVQVRVLRGGKPLTLTATPRARERR